MPQKAEVVLERQSVLGEGALWDSRQDLLYWLDIMDHKAFVYNPVSGENRALDVKNYPSTIVPRESGGAAVTLKNGFAHLDLQSGECSLICEVEGEIDGNRFNDGKCDAAGRFWAGTMDFTIKPHRGALYVLDADHGVRKMLDGVSCSNGIVWTRDNHTMYYIDSLTQRIEGFDFDVETGEISNRRTVVAIPKEVGMPDGMSVDSEDTLWVALFQGGKVNRYDPESGELLETVEVPGASQVTACAFGGSDLRDLYITTASSGYEEQDWKKHPQAGCLFRIRTSSQGVPAHCYYG
jgi:sugar lactone lactonase YvrE